MILHRLLRGTFEKKYRFSHNLKKNRHFETKEGDTLNERQTNDGRAHQQRRVHFWNTKALLGRTKWIIRQYFSLKAKQQQQLFSNLYFGFRVGFLCVCDDPG